jgi:hypothetical protein
MSGELEAGAGPELSLKRGAYTASQLHLQHSQLVRPRTIGFLNGCLETGDNVAQQWAGRIADEPPSMRLASPRTKQNAASALSGSRLGFSTDTRLIFFCSPAGPDNDDVLADSGQCSDRSPIMHVQKKKVEGGVTKEDSGDFMGKP